MKDPKVLLGVCHTQFVFADFMTSMYSLRVPKGTDALFMPGTTLIDQARNEICRMAIQGDFTHIFFMDSDQVFPRDALMNLLAADKDIVSGIYPQRSFFMKPVIYKFAKDPKPGEKKKEFILDWDEKGGPFEIDGCGAGCLLVKTDVLRKIGEPYFLISQGKGTTKDVYMGEDFFFCLKSKEAGFKIWADPSVYCGHLDVFEFTIEEFQLQRDRKKSFLKSAPMEKFKVKCLFCGKEFEDTMEGELLFEFQNNPNYPSPITKCPHCEMDQPFLRNPEKAMK
jgi:hypothetical protein